MALEGTHMRFAFDVKNRYKIKNEAEYIQGTIYPDSRYVSGINRELTHNNDILKPEFASNDFNAGWQVHQLCDRIQRRTFSETIPDFDNFVSEGYQEDWWVAFTAAKIIADMKVVQSFDIQSTLRYLNSTYCPNGEGVSAILKNNQITIDLYKDKTVPTVDDYIAMWNKFGISNELGNKVRIKTTELMDSSSKEIIWSCYDKMVANFDKAKLEFSNI